MRKIYFLIILLCVFLNSSHASSKGKPNILFITVDDMNWNSIGAYGCKIPDITPNIDRLAEKGMRFEHAYVQASNCSPSRNVFQTSKYPHQSGMRGFFYVDANFKSLPEIMKDNGYITGVINKASDSSLSPDFDKYWNFNAKVGGIEKRSAALYGRQLNKFLTEAKSKNQPFYCVVNIADPHKPFFNDTQSIKKGFDTFKPSHIFSLEDVEVPGFLPENPEIKQEVLNYYNSVKRGDDCIGSVLDILEKSEFYDNTIVVFVSDHGMPFPYAKSSVYENGIRTPWIVLWPGNMKKGLVDSRHLVSAIDFMPTVLEIAKIPSPSGLQGKSFYPILKGEEEETSKYVFAQFDENSGGIPRPTRTILNEKFGYIFNAWATGKLPFKSAAESHTTYKTMKVLSTSNEEVKERFEHWIYRSVEELYDYENDPNALNNLIDEPAYQEVVNQLRLELEKHMLQTNDYVLSAFQNRDNLDYLNEWMKKQNEEAIQRSESIQWKRNPNRSGSTKGNTELYKVKY
nr:sulfatase [uncultured Draconibacterium sp.]